MKINAPIVSEIAISRHATNLHCDVLTKDYGCNGRRMLEHSFEKCPAQLAGL